MNKRDHLGMRGEQIAMVRLTEVCKVDELPYFLTTFLGDKSPLFDVLVQLVGIPDKTPFFFAQVKSTRAGYLQNGRLQVSVDKDDVVDMVAYPAPTYVIGIDERNEKAYVVAVHGNMNKTISSLSVAHPLNCDTLKKLWEEVKEYWQDKDMAQKESLFTNEG